MNAVVEFFSNHSTALLGSTLFTTSLIGIKKFFNGGYYHDTTTRLDGKTAIITGANTGIGRETALDLAQRGARVVLACRDLEKAKEATEFIRKKTGNGNVVFEHLDLASLQSVKKFSEKINSTEERIDILINNAGIMACPKWETTDGFEMQFGTNHLGHFYLTNLLLDKIKENSSARIINLSSIAYKRGRIDFSDMNSDKNYIPWKVYEKSKLCNILFTRELAKRLEGTKVTVNALHPGVVRTELGRHMNQWLLLFCYPIIMLCLKSVNQGSQTSIYCAVAPELENVSGQYFADCKKEQILPHGVNEEDAKKLWEISEELILSKSFSI